MLFVRSDWLLVLGIRWNPGLTICQGSVKIIPLNQDIVIAEFPVYDIVSKFLKISLYRDKSDNRLFTARYLINL